jgi:hypothetical protein
MREVVKFKGLPDRKRGPSGGQHGESREAAKLEQPTDRADLYFDDEIFEKKLEQIELEVRVPFAAVRTKIHAGPLSPGPLAISGILCLLVLNVTGAPEWAQLAGMVLPWAIAASWIACGALPLRHGVITRRREAEKSQATIHAANDTPTPASAEPEP